MSPLSSPENKKALKVIPIKAPKKDWLPDKDSNLDYQSQNLTYYHYTIGQWRVQMYKISPASAIKGP